MNLIDIAIMNDDHMHFITVITLKIWAISKNIWFRAKTKQLKKHFWIIPYLLFIQYFFPKDSISFLLPRKKEENTNLSTQKLNRTDTEYSHKIFDGWNDFL